MHTNKRLLLLTGLICLSVIPTITNAVPVTAVRAATPSGAKASPPAHGDEIVVTAKPRRPAQPYRTTIEDVYNVVGFEGAKANVGGKLAFTDRGIDFVTAQTTYGVPFGSVRSFAIEHANRGLMRGTKGMVASFAPQGIGQVYSLFRPGAEMLTVTYVDAEGGLHGAVLMIAEKQKAEVAQALLAAGVHEETAKPDGDRSDVLPVRVNMAAVRTSLVANDLELVMPIASVDIPLAYRAAIYEAMIDQFANQNRGFIVHRDGDNRVPPNAFRLTTTVVKFDKGNAGLRGAVPIVGALAGKTSIQATINLVDSDGSVVLTDDVKGARLLPGESTGAAIGLAKQIGKRIEKADLGTPPRMASR